MSLLGLAMAPSAPKSGLFVGLNKGHIVTKRELAPRPSDRKGVCKSDTLYSLYALCIFICICGFMHVTYRIPRLFHMIDPLDLI